MTGEFKQPPLNTLAYPGGVRIDFIPEADWDTLNLPADRDAE
jgi:hypothetical protein